MATSPLSTPYPQPISACQLGPFRYCRRAHCLQAQADLICQPRSAPAPSSYSPHQSALADAVYLSNLCVGVVLWAPSASISAVQTGSDRQQQQTWMKRSRLLSREFSLNEALLSPRGKSFLEPQTESGSPPEPPTPEPELFKGLHYRRLSFVESNQPQEPLHPGTPCSSPCLPFHSSIQYQKLRLKMQKTGRSEQSKPVDPMQHLWSEEQKKPLKKMMTLRHKNDMEVETVRTQVLGMGVVMGQIDK